MRLQVIIIDDDRIVIMIQERMIIKSNFHDAPISFINGKLGLEYILQNNDSDTIYFILLDINMPVMNGWEFLEAINPSGLAEKILVAIVTSSTNESDRQKALKYKQVIAYIEKPVNVQKLQALKNDKQLNKFFL